MAKVNPPFSDIAVKSDLGVARIHLCLSQALVEDRRADAEAGFRRVEQTYNQGNKRIRDQAAEAASGLGFLSLPGGPDEPGAAVKYREALTHYRTAEKVVTPTNRPRRAFYLSQQGFILSRLEEYEEARTAYAKAIALATDPETRAAYERALERAEGEDQS